MPNRRLGVHALLASVAFATACTTDFTGYHLESSSAGASSAGTSSADAGGASSLATGGSVSSSGSAAGSGGSGSVGDNAGASSGSAGSGAADSGVAGSGSAGSGDAGGAPSAPPPSCAGLGSTCGPDGTASCCAASLVPGGTYNRSNQTGSSATVSDFVLDDYEVSVGRFRNFMQAYSQTMTPAGAGKNPHNLALDPGWSAAWNANLPASATALSSAVSCTGGNYTANAGSAESQPMTCVSWYEAYAFCIWDGGRLPTEAEWNYAAAGGAEERPYPWGSAAPDDAHAVFCPGSCSKMEIVGSKAPTGNGKWGQADMAGNVWEWNLDVYATPYAPGSCQDCANTTASASSLRVFRGGSSGNDGSSLLSATRNSRAPADHNAFVGVRCARTP